MSLVSISSIFGPWMVWKKNAIVHVCLEHVKHMEVCKESIRTLLEGVDFKMLPSKWMKTWRPTAPTSEISKNWKWIKVMGMIITIINDELVRAEA